MNNKLLPIGTVVLLKNAVKRIMIIGYYPIMMQEGKKIMFEYSACLFPEGVIDSKKALLFNNRDIAEIFYSGLTDEEQKDFVSRLKEEITKENVNTNTDTDTNTNTDNTNFTS